MIVTSTTTSPLITTLAMAFAGLSACQQASKQTSGESRAKAVPSAVAEVRTEPTQADLKRPTQVVVLGTGSPLPDAHRAGSSIAVIHRGEAYIFDVGAGSVQNAIKARHKYNIPSLYPSQIDYLFLTHLHSDHTMDYPELAYTLWWRRRAALRVWGPPGLKRMTQGMHDMMAIDTALRTKGQQPVPNPNAYKVETHLVEEGVDMAARLCPTWVRPTA